MGGRRMNLHTEFGVPYPSTNGFERFLSDEKIIPAIPERNPIRDYIGIEIEIERLEDYRDVNQKLLTFYSKNRTTGTALLTAKTDGSLRNFGVEFVTVPIHVPTAQHVIKDLYTFVQQTYSRAEFSERCGIHIHFDVTRLDIQQILWFTLLYIIYEEDIFKFADSTRKESNFCVPLRSQSPWFWFPTNLTDWRNFHAMLPNADRGKYSAMNFCRVRDIGTVEFRHLSGTWDEEHIVTFIRIIQSIKNIAVNTKMHTELQRFVNEGNTTSCYRQLTDEVFKELSFKVCPTDDAFQSVEKGIAFVKKFQWLRDTGGFIPPATIMESMSNTEFNEKFTKFILKKTREIPQPQGNEFQEVANRIAQNPRLRQIQVDNWPIGAMGGAQIIDDWVVNPEVQR